MRKVKIFTDSCGDLSEELLKKHDIDYLQMNTIYRGEEIPATLEWSYYSPKEFYDYIRDNNRVTTTQAPPEKIKDKFIATLDNGYDIVYLGCSSKLSGTVLSAQVVAKEILEHYGDSSAKIRCVDTLNACGGEAILTLKAAELRDAGADADSIADEIEKIKDKSNLVATVHNLNALKMSGRVKASAAFFGNLLGVKPIIISDKDGYNVPIKKAKGRQNSMREIVDFTVDAIEDPENQTIFVHHSDCLEEAKEIVSILKERIPGCKTEIGVIGPIVGASIGADVLMIACFGKSISRF